MFEFMFSALATTASSKPEAELSKGAESEVKISKKIFSMFLLTKLYPIDNFNSNFNFNFRF